MVVRDATSSLMQQHMETENMHPKYREGYMDALLDIYLIILDHNSQDKTAFFQEPIPLSRPT